MPCPDDLRMQRDEIHRLRGAFLDAMVEIDQHLGLAMSLYFSIPKEKKSQFVVGVLMKLTAREKIEAFSKITRARESPYLKALMAKLRELNTYRNELAHSGVSADWEFEDTGELFEKFKWTTTRWTEHGVTDQAIDIDDMKTKLATAQTVGVTIFMITDQIAQAPENEIDPTIDWVDRLASLFKDGIPVISEPLFNYLEVRGGPGRESSHID